MSNGHEFDQSAAYQICLKGILDSSWSDWFGGFSITVKGDETFLIGSVIDQSALYGILSKINELGLSLISVNRLTNKNKNTGQSQVDKGDSEGIDVDQNPRNKDKQDEEITF